MKADFEVLKDAITRRRKPKYIPLYEFGVDKPIIEEIMGYDFSKIDKFTIEGQIEIWKKKISFFSQLGYVYIPVELPINFAQKLELVTEDTAVYANKTRSWADEHNGAIKSMEDIENSEYWPDVDDAVDYELFKKIASLVPTGMKIIVGADGGPFENATFLMGLENLCYAFCEDEELVEKLFDKIGKTLVGIAKRLAGIDSVGAYQFGDDLGYKCGTIVSPTVLRKHVFPWQKKIVQAVHEESKPFILHSCGQLESIMDDLINDVKIDAKHSFEDVIMPVSEAKKIWGDDVAILGGIDVDFLCRSTPQKIKEHTKRVMDICSIKGGYAVGSGNTIANYIPVNNYLAMVEAAKEFNSL